MMKTSVPTPPSRCLTFIFSPAASLLLSSHMMTQTDLTL